MKSNWKLRSKQHEDRIRGEMFDTGIGYGLKLRDEIDNEEETIKVRYRMCDIKGKDLHLIVNAVVALAQELGMLDEEERDID